MSIAAIPSRMALAPMLGVAQVGVQFRFQAAFNHHFSQFFEQAAFTQDILGRGILFEQFILT